MKAVRSASAPIPVVWLDQFTSAGSSRIITLI